MVSDVYHKLWHFVHRQSRKQHNMPSSPSPAATPPSELEADEHEVPPRFVRLQIMSEYIEGYRPGGFYPVHLGDALDNGRYEVLRKLGAGSFATIWLAHDTKFVAVKIIVAQNKLECAKRELQAYNLIAKRHESDNASSHIMVLLNRFKVGGPNGTHLCLVLEPTGPHLQEVLYKIGHGSLFKSRSILQHEPSLEDPHAPKDHRLPLAELKSIIKQILLGLHHLHSCGIVHGDLSMSNVLTSITDADATEENINVLTQEQKVQGPDPWKDFEISKPVARKDGKLDRWAPRYLCLDRPIFEHLDDDKPLKVKISDYGTSFSVKQKPVPAILTTTQVEAPESILGLHNQITLKIDIWAFGCLFYYILSGGHDIFDFMNWGLTEQQLHDQRMLLLLDRLGQKPDGIFEHWQRRGKYYTSDLVRFRDHIDKTDEEAEKANRHATATELEEEEETSAKSGHSHEDDGSNRTEGNMQDGKYTKETTDETHDDNVATPSETRHVEMTIEDSFRERRSRDMMGEECEEVCSLLRKIFRSDPGARPTTGELLELQWFKSIEV